jgi:hypothetical protein
MSVRANLLSMDNRISSFQSKNELSQTNINRNQQRVPAKSWNEEKSGIHSHECWKFQLPTVSIHRRNPINTRTKHILPNIQAWKELWIVNVIEKPSPLTIQSPLSDRFRSENLFFKRFWRDALLRTMWRHLRDASLRLMQWHHRDASHRIITVTRHSGSIAWVWVTRYVTVSDASRWRRRMILSDASRGQSTRVRVLVP